MVKIAKDYTIPELIAANIARQLKDWGLAHVGITQGRGRPYTYVVGIPQVAVALAKMMGYAPHYTWIETVTFNRRIDEVRSVDQVRSEVVRSEGVLGTWPNLVNPGIEHNPKLNDAFSSGAHIDKYGNMSAASSAVALTEAVEEGRVKKGDIILLDAFGAGLTWGAIVIKW